MATLNSEIEESHQRLTDLERRVSDRSQAAQGLQSRAETAEKDRKRLTTLYFQLTKQLEEASLQTTELEQQLSDRSQEVEQIGLRAEAAEKDRNELEGQIKVPRRGSVPKILGSGEPRQRENGTKDKVKSNGQGIGQLLKRLLWKPRSAPRIKPEPEGSAAPKRTPSQAPPTGVRSVSLTPPHPAERKALQATSFLVQVAPANN